jgi:hypothetical protein
MNLFQYADYTALQGDLKVAQSRCQTRRINHIHNELKAVVTDILRDENCPTVPVKNQVGSAHASDMGGTK